MEPAHYVTAARGELADNGAMLCAWPVAANLLDLEGLQVQSALWMRLKPEAPGGCRRSVETRSGQERQAAPGARDQRRRKEEVGETGRTGRRGRDG